VLGGTTVPRYYRGTAVLLFHGTSTVKVTVLPWYRNTTNTAVRYLPTKCEHFSAKEHLFIHRVNKLEVFKLIVDDIWLSW